MIFYSYLFIYWPLWAACEDIHSLTRYQTQALGSESTEPWPLNHQGIPCDFFFFNGWRRSYHIALLFNQSLFLDMLNYYLCFTIINSKQISRSRTFELKYLYMFRFRICTANCTQPTTSTFHYTFTWKSLYTLIRNAYFQHLPSWSVTCFSVLPISLVIKEGSLFFSFLYI